MCEPNKQVQTHEKKVSRRKVEKNVSQITWKERNEDFNSFSVNFIKKIKKEITFLPLLSSA